MRDTLDCAVLMTPEHAGWVQDWVDSHSGQFGRLRLYPKDVSHLTSCTPGAPQLSVSQAMRRFDSCLLPVAPHSLSWTRTMLANVDLSAGVPVIGLLFDICTPAIMDLLSLGVADFVRAPACPDELRARILAIQRRAPLIAPTQTSREDRLVRGVAPIVAAPLPFQPVLHRENVLSTEPLSELETGDVRSTDESFRLAKARVVDGFERAYLRRALLRHSGNVAQAARASCKHRRAFWALMRKHDIDAARYRSDESLSASLS